MDSSLIFLLVFMLIVIALVVYIYRIAKDIRRLTKQYTTILFDRCLNDDNIADLIQQMRNVPPPTESDYSSNIFNEAVYRHLVCLIYTPSEGTDVSIRYSDTSKPIARIATFGTACYVVFRGTDCQEDAIYDCKTLQIDHHSIPLAKVHTGFHEMYMLIRDRMLQEIVDTGKTRVYVVGHSLGGALATLLSYDLGLIENLRVITYSIATPYVVNKPFVQAIAALSNVVLYRVENEHDDICRMLISTIMRENGVIDTYWRPGILILFEDNIDQITNHQLHTYYLNIHAYRVLINDALYRTASTHKDDER